MQKFLLLEGRAEGQAFRDTCKQAGISDNGAVFVFPGNLSHHEPKHNLYSVKGGSGLAEVAQNLGNEGHAVLSLPITNMKPIASTDEIKNDPYASKAIGDQFDQKVVFKKRMGVIPPIILTTFLVKEWDFDVNATKIKLQLRILTYWNLVSGVELREAIPINI
jgi:hypothetical protein